MTRVRVFLILATLPGGVFVPGCLRHTRIASENGRQAASFTDNKAAPTLSAAEEFIGPVQDSPPPDHLKPSEGIGPDLGPVTAAVEPAPTNIAQTALTKPGIGPAALVDSAPPKTKDNPVALVAVETVKRIGPGDAVVQALRSFLDDQPNKALDYLKEYDGGTQDIFIRLLPALARLTQKSIEQLNPEEVVVLQDQLESLLETLRPYTQLGINKLCFCRSQAAVTDPLPNGHDFHAATRSDARDGELVNVYVGLRNLCCDRQDGCNEVRLSSFVEIRNPQEPGSKPIWFHRFKEQREPIRSRGELYDYFNVYSFLVPHIPPGVYSLTLQVEDKTVPGAHRSARKSVEFRVSTMPLSSP